MIAFGLRKTSQSLQIRSVISIVVTDYAALLESKEVAIPSNQVGNFHPIVFQFFDNKRFNSSFS